MDKQKQEPEELMSTLTKVGIIVFMALSAALGIAFLLAKTPT